MLYQRMKNSYAEYVRDNSKRGREFNFNDVNNGWSVIQHDYYELDPQWDQPFLQRITPGQTHDHDPGLSISMIQDKIFRTDQASTVVVTYSRSPQFVLNDRYHSQLSDGSISRSVPPLNRLSDSIWTIWSELTGANARALRYLGQDNVANPNTLGIMKEIFSTLHQTEHVPWPGVTAGIDSMIGNALLGTPNGLATAWLIIDHHGILGRREPTVTIWSSPNDFDGYMTAEEKGDEFGYLYLMLWDLGPPLPYH
ncbi:MAG: hypothetical protein Q9212_002349 [Teloschistes hypoglaucus]